MSGFSLDQWGTEMRDGIFLLAVLLVTSVWGEKVGDLPELNKPASVAVSGSTLYICDSDVIHVYSLNPLQYVRALGWGGEGLGNSGHRPRSPLSTGISIIRS